MSIASEISRIAQNVSDALTAIANKGVTVPQGSNSDDLADLIAQISGGGMTVAETLDSHGGTIVTITGTAATLQAKSNISPTESSQTIEPDTGYTGMSSVQINGISPSYVGSGITRQGAQTIHPSTTDQTIGSGRYLTGTQTIKAVTVSGLAANRILSGTTVKIGDSTDDDCVASVSGSVTFSTIYSGSSAPSSSLGSNGDIYLQTGT